jgi:hypothetical protein
MAEAHLPSPDIMSMTVISPSAAPRTPAIVGVARRVAMMLCQAWPQSKETISLNARSRLGDLAFRHPIGGDSLRFAAGSLREERYRY